MRNVKLTIGIPAYKRPRALEALIGRLTREGALEFAKILVIDDGPCPEIQAILAKRPDIDLVVHDLNAGYPQTYIDLFRHCRTDYIVMMADDDLMFLDGVKSALDFAERNGADFVSPKRTIRGKPGWGKDNTARVLPAEAKQASWHAPGLLYKTGTVLPYLAYLSERLEKDCYIAKTWPQLVIVYCLILNGHGCHWHPEKTADLVDDFTSNLFDADGSHYSSLTGHIKEHFGYIDLLNDLKTLPLPEHSIEAADILRRFTEQEIAQQIMFSLSTNHPAAVPDYVAGNIYWSMRNPVAALRNLFSWVSRRRACHRAMRRLEREKFGAD